MRVAIAGAGYVGLVSAACLAELGHEVRVCDVDAARVAALQAGICPIHEPGLPESLAKVAARLAYGTELGTTVADAAVLLVCVGTPAGAGGEPDLAALRHLAQQVVAACAGSAQRPVVALKSTVPVGTCRWLAQELGPEFAVVSNPEFLREGTAVHDFFHPDRLVVGGPDGAARAQVAALYTGIHAPLVELAWEGAELIKYATNGFLAVKIAFVGELCALCTAVGADVEPVLQGLGLDVRVGPHFLRPGPGYGGSCLPKDLAALQWMAQQHGAVLDLLPAAVAANGRHRARILERLAAAVGGLAGRTVAVWGLTFKAGTDDLRSSAALDLLPRLLAAGAQVQAYDPVGQGALARWLPPQAGLTLAADMWATLAGADGLLILTEWPEFAAAPLARVAAELQGAPVVDARNLWAPAAAAAAGIPYLSLGRPALPVKEGAHEPGDSGGSGGGGSDG